METAQTGWIAQFVWVILGVLMFRKSKILKNMFESPPDMELIRPVAVNNYYYIGSTISLIGKSTLQAMSNGNKEDYLSVLFLESKRAYAVAQL